MAHDPRDRKSNDPAPSEHSGRDDRAQKSYDGDANFGDDWRAPDPFPDHQSSPKEDPGEDESTSKLK